MVLISIPPFLSVLDHRYFDLSRGFLKLFILGHAVGAVRRAKSMTQLFGFARRTAFICFFNTFNTFNRFSTKCCTKVFVHIAILSTFQQVIHKSINIKISQKISFQG
nr:MAG TPA: hypothetical protein [Microviridae sp.]